MSKLLSRNLINGAVAFIFWLYRMIRISLASLYLYFDSLLLPLLPRAEADDNVSLAVWSGHCHLRMLLINFVVARQKHLSFDDAQKERVLLTLAQRIDSIFPFNWFDGRCESTDTRNSSFITHRRWSRNKFPFSVRALNPLADIRLPLPRTSASNLDFARKNFRKHCSHFAHKWMARELWRAAQGAHTDTSVWWAISSLSVQVLLRRLFHGID